MGTTVIYYTGCLESSSDGYYMFFPDLPGCNCVGETPEDAFVSACEILATYAEIARDHNETLPTPTPYDQVAVAPEVTVIGKMLIPLETSEKSVRTNITLSESLLRQIDAVATNRSAFLADAARAALARRRTARHTLTD